MRCVEGPKMRGLVLDRRGTVRSRVSRRWPLGLAAGLVLALGVLALMTMPDAAAPERSTAPAPPVPPAAPAWIDIVKPVEMFGVSAPEFDKQPHAFVARRHLVGGGRQDFLSFGTPDGLGPYLRLSLYRVGTEAPLDAPLFVDVARRAADTSLGIRHAGGPYTVATRFGRFEAVDLDLASEAVPTCTGVRLLVPSPALRIVGLACGPRRRPLNAAALACLLERIDLTAAAEDPALSRFFAASELARNPACAGAAMAPTPLHAPWLDDPVAAAPSRRVAKTSRVSNQKPAKPL